MPSIHILDYHTSEIYKEFQEAAALKKDGEIQYSNFYYKSTHINGTCSDWTDYRSSALLLPFDDIYINKVRVITRNSPDGNTFVSDQINIECNNEAFVASFVTHIKERRNFQGSCNGYTYKIFKCNDMTTFCVNCDEGCKSCPGESSLLAPCRSCQTLRPDRRSRTPGSRPPPPPRS